MSNECTTIPVDPEVWVPVKGYEGYYEVSNKDKVRSLGKRARILKGDYSTNYHRVSFHILGLRRKKLVHRLMAEAFIPNPANLPFINHIDGNSRNNSLSNLEWCTPSENTKHAVKIGLQKVYWTSENHPWALRVGQYSMNGILIKEWISTHEPEKEGFKFPCVARACRGERTHYRGFIWRYI